MAPKNVDDIISTTTADDLFDSTGTTSTTSNSYDDYGLDDFNLDDFNLDDYDLDNYDPDDYNLDDYGLDDYGLDDDDYSYDDYGDSTEDFGGDYSSGSDDYDYDFDSAIDDLQDDYSPGYVAVSDSLYYAAAGIHGVGLLAFIALLVFTLCAGLRTSGNAVKPVKTVGLSLVFYILWSIFGIVSALGWSGVWFSAESQIAVSVLYLACFLVANLLVLWVFYRLLNDRLDRISATSGFHKLIKMFHWGVLGLLSLLNFVYLIVYIASNAKSLHSIDPKLQEASVEFGAAVSIIWWLASLEVLGCSLLVLVRSRSAHGTLVAPITLSIAAFAFFVGTLTKAVIEIRYSLMLVTSPRYRIVVETLFAVACAIVMFIALLILLLKSDKWEPRKEDPIGGEQPHQAVQYQQPMGEYQQPTQYQQVPQQIPGTPPPQQNPHYQQAPQQVPTPPPQQQSPYQQPPAEYAQPQAQYAQVPVPAAYPPSQSPHPA